MKKWRINFTYATFLFLILNLASCKKKDLTVGKDGLSNDLYLNSKSCDTFSFETYSVLEDSVESGSSYFNFFGDYNDPVFGHVNAGFYTQLRLSGLNPNFGDFSQIVVDSFVCALQYAGYYGDLSQQTVNVYQLSDDLNADSAYFTFSTTNYSSNLLNESGSYSFTPDPTSSVIVDTSTMNAQLRIHLDKSIAENIIQHSQTTPADFASQTAFLNYFKGIYIQAENNNYAKGKGGIFTFDTKSTASKVTIYYRLNGVKKSFDLLMNNYAVDYNKISITRDANSSLAKLLLNKNLGKNEFYTQAFGIKAKVDFPVFDQLPSNTVIHRATLELPIQYQTGYKYNPGYYLRIQRNLAFGSNSYTTYTTRGVYDNSRKAFIIDLKNYAQQAVSGLADNTGIYLIPDYYTESVDRIVFNGANTSNKKKPKLTLIYTEYK